MNKFDIGQFEFKEVSRKDTQKGIIEAMLFVSGEPLSLRDIAINLEATPKYVEELLDEMIKDYDEVSRGIKLISINGAYQLVTKAEHSDYIQKLLKKNKRQSLSQASLESLAIAALDERLKRVESGWGIDYKHDAVLGLCYMGAAYMSQHYERTVETAVLGATYVGNSYLANTF